MAILRNEKDPLKKPGFVDEKHMTLTGPETKDVSYARTDKANTNAQATEPPAPKPSGAGSGTTSKATGTANLPKQEPYTYNKFTYDPYAESETVAQANAILQQHLNNKPGAYQNQWESQINSYLNQIENRDPFSYDPNADAMYNMYKDMYIQQGQMASMDAMGQAAALTGGYGNSYAQNVGQQAYNQHLTQLNSILPELQQQAYNRYADEGQRLQDMYSMYMGLENQDYGRYQDQLSNWNNELAYLDDRYNTERQFDYNNWQTKLGYDYDNHTAQENMRWEQYLAEQERNQAAAEMMASAGNYDRLAQLYGLSSDEVSAIKKANAPKYSSSDGEGEVVSEYNIPSDEQIRNFEQEIERGTLDPEYLIQDYAYRYGIDPAYLRNRVAMLNESDDEGGPTLSAKGQEFLNNVENAHLGTGDRRNKNILAKLMDADLSEEDKEIIAYQLKL